MPTRQAELEPTRLGDVESTSSKGFLDSLASMVGPSASLAHDTQTLLRNRLLAAAFAAGLFSGARYLFSLFVPDSGEGLAGSALAARAFFTVAVAAWLASPRSLSLHQLRVVEYAFFGLLSCSILVSQYQVSSELISRGNIVGVVSFDKNGVIRMLVLMLMYGVLIPNHPKSAAKVVLLMALGPIAVLGILHLRHADSHLALGEIAVSNAVFVGLGAVLAIFASYILNNLRTELHDARRLGQYQLGDKIGSGGMGEVYMAEHQLLKRPCALKLINADVATNPLALARFEREVQSAATLSHPNTIEIYDYGHTNDGTFYYVMQYLPGLSVADLVRQFGPMPPGRVVYLMRQVCKSLSEAHRLGMVHRDLKPANIFVATLGGECDVAKVLDFGLVKVTADSSAVQLTAEYTVSGTPSFMSPEQAVGARDVDSRADIYALGAVLYYMVTGKPPFEKENPVALMVAHASEAVRPPSQLQPDVPSDLEAVVLRCLAKAPKDRYADVRALAVELSLCASAGEWDETAAERWWLEQAGKQSPNKVAVGASAL